MLTVCHGSIISSVCHDILRLSVCHVRLRLTVCHVSLRLTVCHVYMMLSVRRDILRLKVCQSPGLMPNLGNQYGIAILCQHFIMITLGYQSVMITL